MSIIVNDLSFSYGNKKVLDKVSFQTKQGSLISLLGPNGIGKSTLFKCLLGIYTHYSGDILYENENIKNLSAKEMARRIAYIPQAHSSVFNYTVLEMVLMGATSQISHFSTPNKEHLELAKESIETVGIPHLESRGFMQLSGGEQQLVLIARALTQQAKFFIMDEPTSNLDYGNQIKILTLLKNLANKGYTILQSTHNPDQTLTFSDSVLALWKGMIIEKGAPKDVITPELIETLYGISVKIESLLGDTIYVCVPQL